MLRWLMLDDGPMDGAANMARDEYIFSRVQNRNNEVILRLYSFDPPAVSVGYHQDPAKVLDLDALSRDGVDLVRRTTGGRALLHSEEFTYCVAASPNGDILGGTLGETFMLLSKALVEALECFGVKAEISAGDKSVAAAGDASPCLVSVSRYEITAGGRKIAGSAQRRAGKNFLQHGSILVGPASKMITNYLPEGIDELEDRVTSIFEEAGTRPDYTSLKNATVEAFSKRFGAVFEKLVFSEEEIVNINQIRTGKADEFNIIRGGQ